MAKYSIKQKDIINSTYVIKIYFFKDAYRKETEEKTMYSKYEGQNERRDAFVYWREQIHYYREKSKFGFSVGDIYNNKDKTRNKKPILRIYGNGTEKWFSQEMAALHV